MKNLLVTAFLSGALLVLKAQNSTKMETHQQDSVAITQALENYYFKGIYEGDINALRNILNPGTLLFGDVKGQPYAKTLDVYLDGVKNRQSPKDSGKPFKSTILSIDVINSIAVAKVQVKMYDFNYDEFLSFHKIDNRWVIVPTGIDAQEISVRSLRRDLTELVSPESEQGSAGRLRYSAFDSGPRVVRLLSYDDWVSLGRGAVIKERQVKRLLRLTTLLAVAVLLAAADRVSVRTGCTSRSR